MPFLTLNLSTVDSRKEKLWMQFKVLPRTKHIRKKIHSCRYVPTNDSSSEGTAGYPMDWDFVAAFCFL
jgi:hypothetical protein